MRTSLVVVAVLAACDGGRSLSDLSGTVVSVAASDAAFGQPGQFAATFATPDCASFAGDVVATFAGQTLAITQPTEEDAQGVDDCVQGETNTLTLPADSLHGQVMTLTLSDSSATWTIAFSGLFDGDLLPTAPVVADQTATFGWTAGPPIENGCFTYVTGNDMSGNYYDDCTTSTDVQVMPTFDAAANTFSLDLEPWMFPPPGTLQVTAIGAFNIGATPYAVSGAAPRTTTPNDVRCDGPIGCWIELSVATSVSF